MSAKRVSDALAEATARMVALHDVTGALDRLVVDVGEVLSVDAAAVLVQEPGNGLEVLTASSHRVDDLELYQVQRDEGPCLDCIRTGRPVVVAGAEALAVRWPAAGPRVVAAGYTWVHASPLAWRGRVFGGLNLFRVDQPDGAGPTDADYQAFADAATMLVVTGGVVDDGLLDTTLREALAARAVVEQAKGAFAHVRATDMENAHRALREFAVREGLGVGDAAREALERARLGHLE
jgi:ANTAR domain-containing protein/GAF domain-containing protein